MHDMRDFRAMRGGHAPRDVYSELLDIEERGKRLSQKRKSWLKSLFKGRPAMAREGTPARSV
jgi:hypothetical protein